jgi:hypothetical protein
MVVAGKAGTTVFFMVTLMAAATLVTRALRAIVALATASQDMPALAGMMAGLDMAEAGMMAGLDMAAEAGTVAEAGMVAGATTDDQDQEVRQQQPAFTRTAAKYPNPSRQRHGRHSRSRSLIRLSARACASRPSALGH